MLGYNENGDEDSCEEAVCKPQSNGFCKTHPTCENVRETIRVLRKDNKRLLSHAKELESENQQLLDRIEKLEDRLSSHNPNWKMEE